MRHAPRRLRQTADGLLAIRTPCREVRRGAVVALPATIMRNHLQLLVLLLATASGAAACTTSDDAWTPPTEEGKSTPIAVIRGSEIPSQLTDVTKFYSTSRALDARALRDLSAASISLAIKADGCLPYAVPDGILEAAELVQLESATDRAHSLSPDEVALMPDLWRFLEVKQDLASVSLQP